MSSPIEIMKNAYLEDYKGSLTELIAQSEMEAIQSTPQPEMDVASTPEQQQMGLITLVILFSLIGVLSPGSTIYLWGKKLIQLLRTQQNTALAEKLKTHLKTFPYLKKLRGIRKTGTNEKT